MKDVEKARIEKIKKEKWGIVLSIGLQQQLIAPTISKLHNLHHDITMI